MHGVLKTDKSIFQPRHAAVYIKVDHSRHSVTPKFNTVGGRGNRKSAMMYFKEVTVKNLI